MWTTKNDHHAHSGHLPRAPDHLQLRVLPSQDGRGLGGAVRHHRAACKDLQPSFVSVTYGAGGSTRERTHDLVRADSARDQPDGRLAPDLRLPHAGRAGRDPRPLRRVGDREHPGPGRRSAARSGRPTIGTSDAFHYAEDLVGFIRSHESRPIRAASASASRAFPRGIPARPTGSRRWTT